MSKDDSKPVIHHRLIILGSGPAGLSAAIRLMQLAESEGRETSVCVVEKGSEGRAHSLGSGSRATRTGGVSPRLEGAWRPA